MNFYNLFEQPSPQNGNVEDYLKLAQIAARSYIDYPNHSKIKGGLETLAKKVAQYRAVRSEESWNSIKATLGDLAKLNIAPSSVLDIAGPAVTDAYKVVRSSQSASDVDAQARSTRAGQGASRAQSQADYEETEKGTVSANADDLPADLKDRFYNIEKGVEDAKSRVPDGVKIMSDSAKDADGNFIISAGTKLLHQSGVRNFVEQGFYNTETMLGLLIVDYLNKSGFLDLLPKQVAGIKSTTDIANQVAADWIKHEKRKNTYEHYNAWGTEIWIPEKSILGALAGVVIDRFYKQHPELKTESINESVDTHDKLVATVANYMYVKHPEIFTQHGDGFVMTVVDDVVSKWEQQDEPMQDIKAYALEVMDALGVERTNENRAQIKTDYKGHHLVNADGEEVQSYPKDAEGLKKARNTLYINHKGLNTMKQEGLNEAFEAALEKLSLNESVTINTTTSSEGQDTVTVTATDEDAYELVALLKAAGLPHKAEQVMATCGEQVEEELANEPTDDVMNGDMDDMNTQSGGLNRRKMQQKYANPLGDNPLAESDDLLRGLWDLYKEAK